MPSKNDLSALKVKSKNSLVKAQETFNKKQGNSTAWRKPKPVMEKQSEIVWLRFTKSELAQIKEKAGLVPVATFLKNELYQRSNLLKEF